jgi:hypothetical protein
MTEMMKYIVVEGKYPVVFHRQIKHKQMAVGMQITSAAMVICDGDQLVVTGFSTTLNLGPAEGDEELLREFILGKKGDRNGASEPH